jgi:hypothetical protein
MQGVRHVATRALMSSGATGRKQWTGDYTLMAINACATPRSPHQAGKIVAIRLTGTKYKRIMSEAQPRLEKGRTLLPPKFKKKETS